MLTFLILVVLIVGGVAAWKMRVPLLAKVLGQSEDRVAASSTAAATDRQSLAVILGRQSTSSLARISSKRSVARRARSSTRLREGLALAVEEEVRRDAGDHEGDHDHPEERDLAGDQRPDPNTMAADATNRQMRRAV